ncbi:hypothetical protein K502DRAFT_363189 [Neoconidiobolus thromboides FSU 785]|nr:hypothetical protein K502DRAFT_363189 [Neoconidiobolus thromboides FSU 785]
MFSVLIKSKINDFPILICSFFLSITPILSLGSSNLVKADPKPLALHSSAIVNNQLIIHGGIQPTADVYSAKPYADTMVFDLNQNIWYKLKTEKTTYPMKFHSSVTSSNYVHTFTAASDLSKQNIPILSLNTDKWTWTNSSNSPTFPLDDPVRIGATLMAIKERLLLYGGIVPDSSGKPGNKAIEMLSSYQIDRVEWLRSMNSQPVAFHSSCYMKDKSVVIVYGGYDGTKFEERIQTFSITEEIVFNAQTKFDYPALANNPGSRIGATLSCVGSKAILIGGGGLDWKPNLLSVYTLDMSNWNTQTFQLEWKKQSTSNSESGPSNLMGHTAADDGKNIYIYGGVGTSSTAVYKLDTTNWSWSALTPSTTSVNDPNDGDDSGTTNSSGTSSNNIIIIAIVSALFGVLMMGAIIGVGLRHWRRKNKKHQKEGDKSISDKSNANHSNLMQPTFPDSNIGTPGRYSQYSAHDSNTPSINGQYLSPIKSSSESKLLSTPRVISRPVSRSEDDNDNSDKWDMIDGTSYSMFSGKDDATSSVAPVPIKFMRPLSPLDSKRSENIASTINHTRSISQELKEPSLAEPASPTIDYFPSKTLAHNATSQLSIDTNLFRTTSIRQNDERMSPLERISHLGRTIDNVNLFSRSPDELSTPTSSIQNWPYREDIVISRTHSNLREGQESAQLFQSMSNIQSNPISNSGFSQRSLPNTLNLGLEPLLAKKLGNFYQMTSPIVFAREDVFATTALEVSSSNSVTILIYLNKALWEKEIEMLQILEGPYVPHIKETYTLSDTSSKSCYVITHSACGMGLTDLLRKQKYPLSDDDLRMIVKQVAQLLSFCHARGVVISDLQPIDLCFSGDSISNRIMLTRIDRCLIEGDIVKGSKPPRYCPPELASLFLKSSTNLISATPAMDVWALGCFIYELYVRKPYMGVGTPEIEILKLLNSDNAKNLISKGIYWDSEGILTLPEVNQLPIEASDVIRSLLNQNPLKRSTTSDILDSDFLLQCKSLPSFSPNISTDKFIVYREPLSPELFSLAASLRKQVVATSEIQAPRLVVVLPTMNCGNAWIDPNKWNHETFRIHFLCEDSLSIHFTNHPGIPLNRPHDFIGSAGPLLSIVSQLCSFYSDSKILGNAHSDVINTIVSSNEKDLVTYFEKLSCVIESFCSSHKSVDSSITAAALEMFNSRGINEDGENPNWISFWINKAQEALLSIRHLALKETRMFIQDNMGMNENLVLGVSYRKCTAFNHKSETPRGIQPIWHAWLCNKHSA